MIFCREVVISKRRGLIRHEAYCSRLYTQERITGLMTSVGFSSITVHKDFTPHKEKGDYGTMTNRMILVAEKP